MIMYVVTEWTVQESMVMVSSSLIFVCRDKTYLNLQDYCIKRSNVKNLLHNYGFKQCIKHKTTDEKLLTL